MRSENARVHTRAPHAALISSVSQAGLEGSQETQGYHQGQQEPPPALSMAGPHTPWDHPQTGNRHNLMEQRPSIYLFSRCNCQGGGNHSNAAGSLQSWLDSLALPYKSLFHTAHHQKFWLIFIFHWPDEIENLKKTVLGGKVK